jgi:hypothetical protein
VRRVASLGEFDERVESGDITALMVKCRNESDDVMCLISLVSKYEGKYRHSPSRQPRPVGTV